MKFVKPNISEIEERLSNILSSNVNIQDLHYYNFEVNNVIYYSFSSLDTSDFPSGSVFLSFEDDQWLIFPSIINILKNIPSFRISDINRLLELSHGKTIPITSDVSPLIIEDESGYPISIGIVNEERFIPITDVGFYIRSE